MLARSAGRRQRRHAARELAASFAQLNLPWLAPAQLRWSASRASASSQPSTRPRRDIAKPAETFGIHNRYLATATDQYAPRYRDQYPLPGYADSRKATDSRGVPLDVSKAKLSNLRPYDDPIIINSSTAIPLQSIKVAHGVQGTAVDLLNHLHTTLQVGRLDRGEAIIRRLSDVCSTGSAEMLYAHTAYLEESLKLLALHGRGERAQKTLEVMQKWFEVEVRGKSVVIDAKLLVVMIRASIRALTGSQRERAVNRYTAMARQIGEDCYYDVLESEDYDDNEFTILGRLTYEETQNHSTPVQHQLNKSHQITASSQLQGVGTFKPKQDLPEVMATSQRGEGLASVKRVLKDFGDRSPLPLNASDEQIREHAYQRQRVIEESAVEVAIERWRKADEELRRIGIHTAMQTKPMGAMMWQWYQALLPALQKELAECRKMMRDPKQSDHDRYHYGPYLELLPTEKVAATTILFTMSRIADKNRQTNEYESEVKLSGMTLGLASAIEQECRIGEEKARRPRKSAHGTDFRQQLGQHVKVHRNKRKSSKAAREREALLAQLQWPTDAKIKFGALLMSKLMETAHLPVTREHPRTKESVSQMQPAFLHQWKYERGKKHGIISPNHALFEMLQKEPLGSIIAKRMPMIVEPKPWKGWNEGGYLHYSNPIMRLSRGDKGGRDYFLAAYKRDDLEQVFAGLTALGEVPWKIHRGVFKVQLDAWNSGLPVANFAPLHPDLEIPPEPPADDLPGRRQWLSQMRDVEHKRTGLHSKRCFQNFQMEVARTMVDEKMYFPHNMDFRGRAYPIPPYLNHMGADNVRGLLVFGEGKELGEGGLRWLKIHLATVAGHDKASMTERVNFTEEHLDDIYDSVRNPLDGRRWWLESEDAWQTLAACFELTDALDSPDPTKFVSHLPIQQDGTCNGLQHYAALGGDKVGAAQVNLEPGDRPADVYTAVSEAVKEEVRKDAAAGNPIAQRLDGHLTRKCVKQPVMTNVYGVTYYGAKEQVQRQLEDILPDVSKYEVVNHQAMAQYTATKIFKSLGSMFTGAQAIQGWLGQCADRISTCLSPAQVATLLATGYEPSKIIAEAQADSKQMTNAPKEALSATHRKYRQPNRDRDELNAAKHMFKSAVVWTTPLRLPVAQPYRSTKGRQVATSLQRIQLHEPQAWHPVSKRKQLQGFPPNFIHSLDATHMLLSALKCKELGMTFASIHDSFWTHACDVDKLGRVLRDAFVEMHKDNIIGRLREEFETRYKGCIYLAAIDGKSSAGKEILEFRRTRIRNKDESSEIYMETERLRLLASDDPAERAKGEDMITPASIIQNEGNEDIFALPSEITNHSLGSMPERFEEETTSADINETEDVNMEAQDEQSEDEVDHFKSAALDAEVATESEPKATKKKTAKRNYGRKIFVWMPLTFPEVPPKGEFDIRKIRQSDYFFH